MEVGLIVVGAAAVILMVRVVWLVVKGGSVNITPMDDAGVRHPPADPTDPVNVQAEVVEDIIEDLIEDVDLMKLTKKELMSMAEAKGVTVSSRMKKSEIVEQLK